MTTWPTLDQTYPSGLHCGSPLGDAGGYVSSEVWNKHRRDLDENGDGQAGREAEGWSMEKQP